MCKHCEFLNKIFKEIKSNYEYWLYTEIFVYLHGGVDHCKGILKRVDSCKTCSKERKPIEWKFCPECGKIIKK